MPVTSGSIVDTSLSGLPDEIAAARLAADGPNELPTEQPESLLAQAWSVVRQPMLLLLLGAGSVNFLLAEPLDGAILLSFVVVVIAISISQEHKTQNALTALRDLSSPRALVVRGSRQRRIPGREVVRGDCILLAEGDRVPADAVLVDAVNFSVDESALTGESVPVRKRPVGGGGGPVPDAGAGAGAGVATTTIGPPGGDDTPWVFSGTLVVKGHGIAIAGATGGHTELGRIGNALRDIETGRTRLQHEIDRLVRVVAVIGLAAAGVVVVAYGAVRGDWLEGTLAGIATAMAMLPEEFPVVLAVFLALGAWRMSHNNVLARRAEVIETLGAATVICVDKTGTLTLNRMTVTELTAGTCTHTIDDGPLPEELHELAEFAALASPIDPFDPMDKAFRVLESQLLAGTEHVHTDWQLVREYQLSDYLLALSHVWRAPDTNRYVVAAKGAPEAIADLCHLGDAEREALRERVDAAAERGLRVLGVARARFSHTDALPTEQHDFAFEYLGIAALHDPLRPGVADAVAACARAGVRVVMITGDHPNTAMAIAHQIGLPDDAPCITGPELAALAEAEVAQRVRTTSVFARMVPEQKLLLVRALQANGEIVGMTGDGVNDAPALRAADIGIAMGARGTDVAREAAALVLTDDDFGSIAMGIRRGRGVFDNLRKAMAYIVAVHVPIVGMSIVPLFVSDWPLVLLPVQIAFLELIIDPACSVVFEAEQIDPTIMDQPPRAIGAPVFGFRTIAIAAAQGLSVLAAVLAVYLALVHQGAADGRIRAVTFATLVLANLGLILVNRSWRLPVLQAFRERRNPTLKWILGVAVALLVALLTVPPVRDGFGFAPIRPLDALVASAAAAAGVTWFELYKIAGARRARGQSSGNSSRSIDRASRRS